jgi:hypothetical protein
VLYTGSLNGRIALATGNQNYWHDQKKQTASEEKQRSPQGKD